MAASVTARRLRVLLGLSRRHKRQKTVSKDSAALHSVLAIGPHWLVTAGEIKLPLLRWAVSRLLPLALLKGRSRHCPRLNAAKADCTSAAMLGNMLHKPVGCSKPAYP